MQIISHQNHSQLAYVVASFFRNSDCAMIRALSSIRKSQRFFEIRALLPLSFIVAWFLTEPHMYDNP